MCAQAIEVEDPASVWHRHIQLVSEEGFLSPRLSSRKVRIFPISIQILVSICITPPGDPYIPNSRHAVEYKRRHANNAAWYLVLFKRRVTSRISEVPCPQDGCLLIFVATRRCKEVTLGEASRLFDVET